MSNIHATAVARHGHAVLLLGASGSGKSDLALRLIDRGWGLIADDRVDIIAQGGQLWAHCPPAILGQMEVRGVGICPVLPHHPAPIALTVKLSHPIRVQTPATWLHEGHALPHFHLAPFEVSAALKVEQTLALVVGALG